MDFNTITSKFKSPVFLLLAVGVGGIAVYNLAKQETTTTIYPETYDTGGEIYPVNTRYTEEDIKNFTENIYYSLAETVGQGIEDLGNIIAENQTAQFSNLQTTVKNDIGDILEDVENILKTTSPTTTKKTTTAKKTTTTPKYVTVSKWTSSNTKWNSTLSGIAAHYGTTISKLLKLNPTIKNPDLIYTGQKIRYV
jgi:LysM repeat protein